MSRFVKTTAVILALCLLTAPLAGCGEEQTTNLNEESSDEALRELENGRYYIRHADDSCEPVYFGEATFDVDGSNDTPDPDRVMWFKEDFEEIPTLYNGDSLIMYTTAEFDEKFRLERFLDYGYTLGFCKISLTNSGRFQISTNVSDRCTYPRGDTDVIVNYKNSYVILDSLGDVELREYKDEFKAQPEEGEEVEEESSCLSDSGTIIGLEKDAFYTAELYEGTVRHTGLTFQANVRALGSMEVTTTFHYSFNSDENIVTIEIPDFLNDGYYLINGAGLFRLYRGAGDYIDDPETFNVLNEIPERKYMDPLIEVAQLPKYKKEVIADEAEQVKYTGTNYGEVEFKKDSSAQNSADTGADKDKYPDKTDAFELDEAGQLTIKIAFVDNESGEKIVPEGVTAVLVFPSGKKGKFAASGTGLTYTADFYETGRYNIIYYNLGDNYPNVTFE